MTETTLTTQTDLLTADLGSFELMQRKAKMLQATSVIPDRFKNNLGDIIVAMDIAHRMNMNYLSVMQSLYVVYGQPAWSAAYMISCFNGCGRFSPITYVIQGEGLEKGCYATAVVRETGEEIQGPVVTMQMAQDEGWINKKGSKWKTMPELMLRYRAATFLIRTTAPELTLGIKMQDEVEDVNAPLEQRTEVTHGADQA